MFFRYFPTISYKIDNHETLITDISVAFLQKRLFLDKAYKFRKYTILEGERPEEVSYKLYGSVRYHWVLLVLNNIVDPMTEWFMSTDLLMEYTEAKYPEIPLDTTNKSGMFGVNHYRYYYDEKDSNKYLRLDPVEERAWRYKGGRSYANFDQIIIAPPNDPTNPNNTEPNPLRATAYINRIDELGAITDVVITNRGVEYPIQPAFKIISENGTGFEGELILDGSSEVQEMRILPIGEQIHPISNLHLETELNVNRREILAITPENISLFEEELYYIMGSI